MIALIRQGHWVFALCSVLVLARGAAAQPPYNPYYPYYPPSYGPIGNQLQGQASVISATGQLYTDQEQARILREQANQAKLVTKKKAFDLNLYEKAMTPTFTEEMNKNQSMQLRRVLTGPNDLEITSGKAQNIILPVLARVATRGAYGPQIPLEPDILKYVNVTGAGSDGSGLGVLKNGGRDITWPMALVDSPTQKRMAELLPQAVAEASKGMLKLDTYNKVSTTMESMQKELSMKFRKEEIDGGIFIEGKRFLDSLDGSIKILRTPSAPQYFNGNYTAEGRTVQQLVDNMTMKGLKFAPCNPGYEAPYFALYNAMVAYASGHGEDPSGFVNLQAAKYPQKNPKNAWR